MRLINRIVIHCSATEYLKKVTVDDIRDWHKQRGFRDVGYHYVIYADGQIVKGREIDSPGAHAEGYNGTSIGVCYIGGLLNGKSWDTRTVKQKQSLKNLISALKIVFPAITKIDGHRDLSVDLNGDGVISKNEWMKDCPCFNVHDEF